MRDWRPMIILPLVVILGLVVAIPQTMAIVAGDEPFRARTIVVTGILVLLVPVSIAAVFWARRSVHATKKTAAWLQSHYPTGVIMTVRETLGLVRAINHLRQAASPGLPQLTIRPQALVAALTKQDLSLWREQQVILRVPVSEILSISDAFAFDQISGNTAKPQPIQVIRVLVRRNGEVPLELLWAGSVAFLKQHNARYIAQMVPRLRAQLQ